MRARARGATRARGRGSRRSTPRAPPSHPLNRPGEATLLEECIAWPPNRIRRPGIITRRRRHARHHALAPVFPPPSSRAASPRVVHRCGRTALRVQQPPATGAVGVEAPTRRRREREPRPRLPRCAAASRETECAGTVPGTVPIPQSSAYTDTVDARAEQLDAFVGGVLRGRLSSSERVVRRDGEKSLRDVHGLRRRARSCRVHGRIDRCRRNARLYRERDAQRERTVARLIRASKIGKWQSREDAGWGASRVARGWRVRSRRAPPPVLRRRSKAARGWTAGSATSERVEMRGAVEPAPRSGVDGVPTARLVDLLENMRERGRGLHDVHVGGVDGGEEGGVGRSDVGGGCEEFLRERADVDRDDARRSRTSASRLATRHRVEDVDPEDDAHGARAGCADAVWSVSRRGGSRRNPSSTVMRRKCWRRRRPAFGAYSGGRAECRAAGGVRGAGRARALARAVHEDDARSRVLLEEHLGEATHGGVGVRTRSAKRDRAEGARSRTGPEEAARPTRARPEGTSTPRKTRGGELSRASRCDARSRGPMRVRARGLATPGRADLYARGKPSSRASARAGERGRTFLKTFRRAAR